MSRPRLARRDADLEALIWGGGHRSSFARLPHFGWLPSPAPPTVADGCFRGNARSPPRRSGRSRGAARRGGISSRTLQLWQSSHAMRARSARFSAVQRRSCCPKTHSAPSTLPSGARNGTPAYVRTPSSSPAPPDDRLATSAHGRRERRAWPPARPRSDRGTASAAFRGRARRKAPTSRSSVSPVTQRRSSRGEPSRKPCSRNAHTRPKSFRGIEDKAESITARPQARVARRRRGPRSGREDERNHGVSLSDQRFWDRRGDVSAPRWTAHRKAVASPSDDSF